jgi:hypothetical protein
VVSRVVTLFSLKSEVTTFSALLLVRSRNATVHFPINTIYSDILYSKEALPGYSTGDILPGTSDREIMEIKDRLARTASSISLQPLRMTVGSRP